MHVATMIVGMTLQVFGFGDPGSQERTHDVWGDVLPYGCISRLGTVRLRTGGGPSDAMICPRERLVATTDTHGTVRLWDVASGQHFRDLRNPDPRGCFALAFSRDGTRLASLGGDGRIFVWNVFSGRRVLTIPASVGGIGRGGASIQFSHSGTLIAFLHHDSHTIRFHDASDGFEERRIDYGDCELWDWTLDDTGGVAAVCGSVLRVWDVASGRLRSTTALRDLPRIDSVIQHPRSFFDVAGRWIGFRGTGSVVVRSRESMRDACRFDHEVADNPSVAFSPTGTEVAIAADDYTVRLFSLPSGKEVCRLAGAESRVRGIQFSRNGTYILACTEQRVRIWDRRKSRELSYSSGAGEITCAVVSPNADYVATQDSIGLRIWRLRDSRQMTRVKSAFGSFFDENGEFVTTLVQESRIEKVSTQSGRIVSSQGIPTTTRETSHYYDRAVRAISRSKSGKLWAYRLRSGQIEIWNPSKGTTRELNSKAALDSDLRFSQLQENLLLDGGHLWDTNHSLSRFVFGGDFALFHPNGNVVTLRKDAFVQDAGLWAKCAISLSEWSCKTGDRVREFGLRGLCFPDDTSVVSCVGSFSPKGEFVAIGGANGCIHIIDWELAQPCLQLSGHSGSVTSVCFSSDGSKLVSASEDGTALVWAIGELLRRLVPRQDSKDKGQGGQSDW